VHSYDDNDNINNWDISYELDTPLVIARASFITYTWSPMIGFRRFALLWCLFLLICLGLGYPTLNRYDPQRRDPDTVQYREMVIHGSKSVPEHFAHRVLIPYAAHLFYRLTENRIGSWTLVTSGF